MADWPGKERFDRAFRIFAAAHARGMRSLRERDFRAFQQAIDDESAAVENASEAINDALGMATHHSAIGRGASGSASATEAEHTRLFVQMEALEREHRELEMRPHAIEAHREHRARLRAHIAELKAHFERLRAQDPTGPPPSDG